MNKVYKVVWCHVRNTYVVASELASRKKITGKSGSLLKTITLGATLALALNGVSSASTGTNGGTGSGTALSPSNNECGGGWGNNKEANAQQKGNIAIGCESDASDTLNTYMYDRGNPKNQMDSTSIYSSIAIGAGAKADRASVSIGAGSESKELGVAFGSQARSRGVAAIALGAAALSSGNTSLALGRQSAATGDFAQAIGNVSIAEGKGSLAMGHSATATGNRSIAIGSADIDNAGSTGDQKGVMYQKEQQTLSTGKDSIAIGAAAKAQGDYTLAVGAHAKASGSNSTAMGYDASATGKDSFAAGRSANAVGQDAFALGANAHGQGEKSFAMGTGSQAIGKNALALGSLSVAKEKNSIAVGVGAQANFADSVALGSNAVVSHDNSISIGTGSTTNDYDATAFLYEEGVAGAVATGSVSIGNGAGAVSEGSKSNERRLQNLAAGSLDTDAVNVSQLKLHKAITDKTGGDIAKHLGGDSTFNTKTGAVTNPTYVITNKDGISTNDYKNVGSAFEALDSVVVNNTTNIQKVFNGEAGIIQVAKDGKSLVIDNNIAKNAGVLNIAGGPDKNGSRKLTGLMNGEVKKDSRDAVTGDQLHDVSELVDTNTKNITKNKDNLDLASDGLALALGGGAAILRDDENNFTFKKPAYEFTNRDDQKKVTFDNVGDALGHLDSNIQNINEGKTGLVKLGENGQIVIDNEVAADYDTFNIANVDADGKPVVRTLTGVAAGKVADDSVDAINGSQLHAATTKVAEVIGGGAEVDAEGNLTDPTFNITDVNGKQQGHNTVGDALEALDAGVVNNTTNITNLEEKSGASLEGIAEALGGNAAFDKDSGVLSGVDFKDALGADDAVESVYDGFDFVKGKIDGLTNGEAGLVKLGENGQIVIDNEVAADYDTFNIANVDADGKPVVRTLTGVAAGKVADDSVDAINGSQLHAATTKVAEVIGGGAEVDAEGNLTDPTFNITDVNGKQQGHNTVGDALEALDAGVVNNTTNITNLEEKSGASLEGIAEALGGNAAFDKDSGVLSGVDFKDALGADDAVESVYDGFDFVKGKIDGLTNGEAGLVKLGENGQIVIDNEVAADYDTFNIANVDADGKPVVRTLTGVAAGKVADDSVDAINGSQLHAATTKVAEVIGGGAEVDAEGNLTDPTFNITDVNGKQQGHNTVGDALEALDAGVVNNTTNITNLEEKSGASLEGIAEALGGNAAFDKDSGVLSGVDFKDALGADDAVESVYDGFGFVKGKIDGLTNGEAGLVKLGENGQIVIDNEVAADYDTFNIANVDADGKPVVRTLTGVAAGKVADDSVDAINGSQLHAATTKVAEVIGGGAEVDAEGNLTDPTFNITDVNGKQQGHNTVGDALEALDAGVVNNTTNITNLEEKSGASLEGIAEALGGNAAFDKDSGVLSGVDFKDALGADDAVESVYDGFGFVKGKIDGLTNGEAGLVKLGENGQIVIDNEVAADYDTFNIANVDADGKPVVRTLTGVAAGKVADDSVDAINGSQLHAATTKVAEVIGGGAEVDAEGNLTDPTFNITDVNGKQQGHNTVGDALEALDAGVVNNTTNITNLEEKSGASLEGIAEALGGNAAFDKDSGVLSGVDFKDALGADDAVESVYDGFGFVKGKIDGLTNGEAGLVKLGENGQIVIDNEVAADYDTFNIANVDADGKPVVRTLTGVAAGKVADDSVDAINGSQLHAATTKVAEVIGGGAEVDAEGNLTDPTFNITDVNGKQQGHNTVGDALEALDAGVVNNTTNITNLEEKSGASLEGIAEALGGNAAFDKDSGVLSGVDFKDALGADDAVESVYDGFGFVKGKIDGLTNGEAGLVKLGENGQIVIDNEVAADYDTFNIANVDADGKPVVRTLTGVAAGKVADDSVDAINGSQLFTAKEDLANIIAKDIIKDDGSIEAPKFVETIKVVQKDAEGKPVLDDEGNPVLVEQKQTGFNTIKEAIDSLGQGNATIADSLGGGSTVNVDGSITGPTYNITNKDGDTVTVNNVGDALTTIDNSVTNITNGKSGLVQLSDDNKTIIIDNELAADATSFNIAGKDAERKLTGVAKGDVKADSVDAINGSQLFDANVNIANIIGGEATVNAETGVIEGSKFLAGLDAKVQQLDDEGKPVVDADGNPVMVDAKTTGFNNITDAFDSLGKKDQALVDALGGGSTVNVDGSITGPTYNITNKDGDTVTVNNVGDALTTIDNSVTNITSGKSGLVQLSDDNKTIIIDNELAADATSFNIAGKDAERKLTGIAKGDVKADSVDAINGSQLFDTKKDLADIIAKDIINADGSIEAPTFIDTIQVVQKDAGNIVLDDAGNPVLVTQTQDGFNTIKEAIDSLGQGNAVIVDSLGGGSVVNPDGSITGPTYVINGDNYYNVGDAITNIDGRVIDNSSKINDITNSITTGKAGLVQLSDDNKTIMIDNKTAKSANTFDISNGKEARKLTGVAKGDIAANSVDGINGGQLYDIGKYVAEHAASYLGGDAEAFHIEDGEDKGRHKVRGLDFRTAFDLDLNDENGPDVIDTVYGAFDHLHDSIENGDIGLLQMKGGKLVFSDVAKKATEFDVSGEDGPMTITGVKNGVADLDAVNVSQLKGITTALGGGAGINADGSIKAPTYTFIEKDEDGNNLSFNNVGSALENLDGRVIDNTKNITNLTENVNNINKGEAGLVKIDGDRIVFDSSIAGGRTFDISNNGQARKMTGVADGTLAAGSKDAVNGGQLHDTNQNVAKNTDNIGKTTDALGGGAGIDKDGNYKGPNYSFTDGSNHTNVGSALDNLDGRVDSLDKKVDGIANGTEGLVKLETDENGNQKLVIDNNLASKADTFDISNGDKDRTLTGVADGKVESGSKDAINGGQLHDSNQSIADIFGGGASIDKDGYVSMPNYDFGDKNTFNNVGDSLTHLNNKITNGEGGLFKLDRENNQIILADNKDINKETVVNMGDRKIVGVANGKVEQGSLEAVNGGQLWETNQQVSTNTNQIKHINNTLNHYNTRMNHLEKTVHENRKRASAGTASAMAMSSIPYLDYAKYSFGMGVASYDGEAAMSLGLEFRMGDNGRFRIQGSYDTQNKAGVGVGMAFEL